MTMEVDRIYAVKKQLKKWEAAFFETHERKPSKTDIEAAPQRIQGKNIVKYVCKLSTFAPLLSPPCCMVVSY